MRLERILMLQIPHGELGFFQREGAKRKRQLPPGLSPKDAEVLKSVRSKAYNLDLAFECCCGWKVGWSGLIGILPWIGDAIAAFLALKLIRKAQQVDGGLPKFIEAQMMANLTFDFLIGLIPIVGDIINIAYKANSRNCILLEQHLKKNRAKRHGSEVGATAAAETGGHTTV